jgi:hypothetical protein
MHTRTRAGTEAAARPPDSACLLDLSGASPSVPHLHLVMLGEPRQPPPPPGLGLPQHVRAPCRQGLVHGLLRGPRALWGG